MLTADGEAGDTPLQFFTQNTMPLSLSGLFFHNHWGTCGGLFCDDSFQLQSENILL